MLRLTVLLAVVFVGVAAWPAAAQVMGNHPWMGASQTNVYFNNGPTYGSDHGHYGKDHHGKDDDYYKSRMSMSTVHVLTSENYELLDTIKWARNSIRMMCHVNDVEFHVVDSMEDQATMWKADVESKWPKLHLNILSNVGLDKGLKDHLYADLSDSVTFKTLRPLDSDAVEAFVRDDMLFAIPESFRSLSFITTSGQRPANSNDLRTQVQAGNIKLRFITDDPIYSWGIMNMIGAIAFNDQTDFTNNQCGGGRPLENFFNYVWNLGLDQRNAGGPKLFDSFEQTLIEWKAGTINTVVDGNWAYAHYKALQPTTTAWNGPAGFRPFKFYNGVAFNPLMDKYDAMAAECVAKVLTGKDQQGLLQSMGGVVPVNLDVIAASPLSGDLQSFVDDVDDFPVDNQFFLEKFFGDDFEAAWTDLFTRIDANQAADANDLLRDHNLCP